MSIDFLQNREKNISLMCSGSRDRLIHIFDANKDFELKNTCDDHSSSVTKVKMCYDKNEQENDKKVKILSCGGDKTLIFRNLSNTYTPNVYHKEVSLRFLK